MNEIFAEREAPVLASAILDSNATLRLRAGDGGVIGVNAAARALLPEEKDPESLTAGDLFREHDILQDAFRAVEASGQPRSVKLHPVDGGQVFAATLVPVPGSQPAEALLSGTVVDVQHGAPPRLAALDRVTGVVEMDINGTILSANAMFLELTGYTHAGLVFQNHNVLCPPDPESKAEEIALWKRLALGRLESGEFLRLRADAKPVWMGLRYIPLPDPAGGPAKVVMLAEDVTETREARVDLETRLEAFMEDHGVADLGIDGEFHSCNEMFLDIFGCDWSDVIGQPHRAFCAPQHVRSKDYRKFWDRLAEGETIEGEFIHLNKSGEEIWVQARYTPVMSAYGKPKRVFVFLNDITEVKKKDTEYRNKIDAIDRNLAMVQFDLESNVVACNQNFLRVMGYTAREVIGEPHAMFCDAEFVRSQDYRDFWDGMRSGEMRGGRFHRLGKFGRDVWLQATYSPLVDIYGEPSGYVKFAQDVTSEVQLDRQVRSIADSMDEMASMLSTSIEQITTATTRSQELAREASSAAQGGLEAINSAIESIDLIQTSSQKISEILKIIGEIANQTNLLAFNAAIEAARAGEHGIGFTVVADEVRKLAERSSGAAHEIAKLINESSESVSAGTQRSRDALQAFESIVSGVSQTAESIGTITETARSQEEVSTIVMDLILRLSNVTPET